MLNDKFHGAVRKIKRYLFNRSIAPIDQALMYVCMWCARCKFALHPSVKRAWLITRALYPGSPRVGGKKKKQKSSIPLIFHVPLNLHSLSEARLSTKPQINAEHASFSVKITLPFLLSREKQARPLVSCEQRKNRLVERPSSSLNVS